MAAIEHNGSFKPYGRGKMIVVDSITIKLTNIEGVCHTVSIPEGYIFDGASIPKFGWLILGPPFEPEFILPALIHDWYCEHADSYHTRVIGDAVFFKLLKDEDVPYWKRTMMYILVRLYAIIRIKH